MRAPIGLMALLLAGCATAPTLEQQRTAADYASVLADPARPAAERERDAARKPAELLAFAGVERGMKVGDWVMGGGYMTRLLSAAVGPQGRVYAFQPAEFIAYRSQYGDDQRTVDAAYENVVAVGGPFAAPAFPEPLDMIVTVQNFHDLYLAPFPQGTGPRGAAALFAALKPGGTLVLVDHSALAGTGTRDSDRLHRIDREHVLATMDAAGFVLDGESNLYARPADPRTANVFDAGIRGQTDQFTLRFRKPGPEGSGYRP